MSQGPYDPNNSAGPPQGPDGQPQQPGYTQPDVGQQPPPSQPASYGQAPAYGQQPPAYGQPAAYGQDPAYGQQPGYPPQGAYGQPSSTPGLAIAGLVLAFLFWPVGLVLSIVALAKSKQNGGKGLAVAGLVVSILALIVTVVAIFVSIFSIGSVLSGPSDAVTTMNEALIDDNCEAFVDVTTDAYRSSVGLNGCDNWQDLRTAWVGGMTDYTTHVTNVSIENATARVETTETYLLDGSQASDEFSYALVRQGGDWRVDAVY